MLKRVLNTVLGYQYMYVLFQQEVTARRSILSFNLCLNTLPSQGLKCCSSVLLISVHQYIYLNRLRVGGKNNPTNKQAKNPKQIQRFAWLNQSEKTMGKWNVSWLEYMNMEYMEYMLHGRCGTQYHGWNDKNKISSSIYF